MTTLSSQLDLLPHSTIIRIMTIEETRFETSVSSNSVDVKGHALIIPCVSIGSVPQLAIDALLESSGVQRREAHASKSDDQVVQGPLRVYTFAKSRVTILQQRSPIVKSRKQEFVKLLIDWAVQKGFESIIVLTSLDAGLRTDSQMNHPFWYFDTGISGSNRVLAKMQSILPVYQSSSPTSTTIPAMPSGGLAKAYLESATKLQRIPTQALVTFAAEGDNRDDALAMATLLLTLLNLSDQSNVPSFKQPADWSLLFGSQTNDSMFN